MKSCTKCKLEKSINQFDFSKGKGKYTSECKECRRTRQRIFIRTNPQQKYKGGGYKYIKKRRAEAKLKYGIPSGMFSRYGSKVWLSVMKKYDYRCDLCKADIDLTFHHLNGKGRHYNERTRIPMDNRIENIQVLCRKCHGSIDGKKGGRPVGFSFSHP